MKFDWHDKKAETNEVKHGVSFEEAREVFYDPDAKTLPDDEHSWEEQRMRIYGSTRKRLLTVIYVEIIEDYIWIISAREMTKREKRLYYEN